MSWIDGKAYDDWKLNPPEPDSQFHCSCCGESLWVGDKYMDIEGEKYCYDCASEWFNDQWQYATEGQCNGEIRV